MRLRLFGAGLLVALVGVGLVVYGWPLAKGLWQAQRLAQTVATGADGRTFTTMDVLEGVAAEAVQRAIKAQEAQKAQGPEAK